MRPVTQGDVIRADTKEIPRIFQLLYAGEGEARRPDDPNQQDMNTLKGSADERPGIIIVKGKAIRPVLITYNLLCQYLCTSNHAIK